MFDEPVQVQLGEWVAQLAVLPRDVSDEHRVSRLRTLEEISAAVAAAQARDAADLDASRRAQHAQAGRPAKRWGEGVAAEVALARRVSPSKGNQLLGLAKVLTSDMPHTLALMASGRLSEWRATILVKETVCLEAADRRFIDEQLCGGADPRAVGLGDRALGAAAKQLAAQVDAAALVKRAARAESERCVTIRPAPDAMAWVSALLPMAAGVGVYAALKRAADLAPPEGEPRSRGQRMADALVERVTGRNPLERPMDLDLRIVLPASSLLPDGEARGGAGSDRAGSDRAGSDRAEATDDSGYVSGPGCAPMPLPGPLLRKLIAEACQDEKTRVFVRQLYSSPHGGLVAMASTSRCAPPGMADLIRLRDQVCRTPWCEAPVRHIDHIKPAKDGGSTEVTNLQGLCERCNYAREAPGWAGVPVVDGQGVHRVEITSPTGHRYVSSAPPLPGTAFGPKPVPAADTTPSDTDVPPDTWRDEWVGSPPDDIDEDHGGVAALLLPLEMLDELRDVPVVQRFLHLLQAA
ncbi:MAG: DUF222 domain-containing protein [Actinomycetales bacterium]